MKNLLMDMNVMDVRKDVKYQKEIFYQIYLMFVLFIYKDYIIIGKLIIMKK